MRIVVTVGDKIGKTHPSYGLEPPPSSGGDGSNPRRRRLRASGIDDTRAVERCRWHHGGERVRPALEHGAQHRLSLGADHGGGGVAGRGVTLLVAPTLLGFQRDRPFQGSATRKNATL